MLTTFQVFSGPGFVSKDMGNLARILEYLFVRNVFHPYLKTTGFISLLRGDIDFKSPLNLFLARRWHISGIKLRFKGKQIFC